MTHNQDQKPEKPVMGEIAASGAELNLAPYIQEIEQSGDELLKSLGGDLTQYEKLLRDEQVQSAFQQRRRAVTSTEWEVEPASESSIDKQAADFLRDQLKHLKWDRITDKMLYGTFYGYAVAELIYAIEGGRVVIDTIKVRKAKRFVFGRDGTLRLKKPGQPKGVIMPERKFWTYSVGADNDDDPYGRGLGYWLYWPIYLKRNGAKFWAMTLEKFGGPTVVGKYSGGAQDGEIRKLLEAAVSVQTDAAVAIPQGMELEIMESTKRAGGDFNAFMKYWDAAIAKVVLSQTMTTDDGSSQSQASVHMEVRQDVVKGDADLNCESFNDGPARWLTEWNFPGAGIPNVWRIIEEPEDMKAISGAG